MVCIQYGVSNEGIVSPTNSTPFVVILLLAPQPSILQHIICVLLRTAVSFNIKQYLTEFNLQFRFSLLLDAYINMFHSILKNYYSPEISFMNTPLHSLTTGIINPFTRSGYYKQKNHEAGIQS
jgi:hypothetical protein